MTVVMTRVARAYPENGSFMLAGIQGGEPSRSDRAKFLHSLRMAVVELVIAPAK
jgi:hypothetical protein